jgi:hypothetical protein
MPGHAMSGHAVGKIFEKSDYAAPFFLLLFFFHR